MSNQRTGLDTALLAIRDNILRMAGLVHKGIAVNFAALQRGDSDMLRAARERDQEIDDLHRQVEEQVVMTIVREQPVAQDLRLIAADLWLASELERMGDYAKGFARIAARGAPADLDQSTPPQMKRMVTVVQYMLQASIEAYIARDANAARLAAGHDDEVDDLYRAAKMNIIAQVEAGTISAEWSAEMFRVAHYLERLGDRVTNICERVVYVATAQHEELNP